jgi:uncharacterized protein YcbK (DUF882 family)
MIEYLSDNFTIDEMQCPCCKKCEMDPKFIETLQGIRDYLNIPMKVTSGYRCRNHNELVGGAPNSKHLSGIAVDVSMKYHDSQRMYELIQVALSFGIQGIGISKSFIHLDAREQPGKLWTY